MGPRMMYCSKWSQVTKWVYSNTSPRKVSLLSSQKILVFGCLVGPIMYIYLFPVSWSGWLLCLLGFLREKGAKAEEVSKVSSSFC